MINCPGWDDTHHGCPCRNELICHAVGEVDDQTARVVSFWQVMSAYTCLWEREYLPGFGPTNLEDSRE